MSVLGLLAATKASQASGEVKATKAIQSMGLLPCIREGAQSVAGLE